LSSREDQRDPASGKPRRQNGRRRRKMIRLYEALMISSDGMTAVRLARTCRVYRASPWSQRPLRQA